MLNIATRPEEPIISIGVAAKKLGVSPESLRLYEREGLVIPYRTSTGRRLFSQKDLEWIDCFRTQIIENKMNFAGIRILLALLPCWDLKPCSEVERKNCPAYFHSNTVCWTVKKLVLLNATKTIVWNVLCIMMLAGLESWIQCIFLLRKNEEDYS